MNTKFAAVLTGIIAIGVATVVVLKNQPTHIDVEVKVANVEELNLTVPVWQKITLDVINRCNVPIESIGYEFC